MLFQEKIDRALKWVSDKNKTPEVHDLENSELPSDSRAEWLAEQKNEEIKLEKDDIWAIIISAILVFGPVFLVLLTIAFIAYFAIVR